MPNNKKLLAIAIGLIFPCLAFAEDASQIEKRFQKPPEPKATTKPLVFPIDEKQPPAQAAQLRFTLKELTLKGNTVFTKEQLAPLYQGMLGKEISLLDIYKLRDAITAQYGNAGYGLSKAVVPEQRIQAEGLVRIDIIEGFVDEVIIEGATDLQKEFLAHAAEKIKAERPLRATTLERYLLLANDRFAIKVTSTMKASEKTPGASTLILKVEEAPKVDGGASLDNRGTVAVGKVQFNGDVSLNGLGGRASKTTLGYATVEQPKELQYWTLTHTELLTNEGTTLSGSYAKSKSKPGTPILRQLENVSDSTTWALKLAHPFIRTRQENLTASVKYESKDTESEILNAPNSQDKIRSIRLGLNYDRADAWEGVNQVLAEASFGLKGMGASSNDNPIRSRTDGKTDYRKITLNLSRNQQLGVLSPALQKFSLNFALMGQYAGTGLLSSEQCGVGGQQFGRAYDSSEILGDKCIAGSLELRYSLDTGKTPFKYTQFYSFYDGGKVTNRQPLSVNDPKSKSLSSAGLGMRFGLGEHVTGSIEAAKPLTRIVANEGDRKARIFASISVRF